MYPKIDVSYSPTKPLQAPVILTLSSNGLRLRFDGPDQRLRLVEVLDFTKTGLSYKNTDLVKLPDNQGTFTHGGTASKPAGPPFRHVYNKLFGPTFPGEYHAPTDRARNVYGTYVLSYPGLAFSFPLQDSAWSSNIDFVSLLSSSAALSASCLTIFNGSSWKEARQDLYTRACTHPRSLALTGRQREGSPDEIELIRLSGNGRIELIRRSSSPFQIILSETTPQDLVAELGPPDAIYRKNDRRLSIHKPRSDSRGHHHPSYAGSPGQDDLTDTDRSSTQTNTDDSDVEDGFARPNEVAETSAECFYNYFHHGFDIFVSYPTSVSSELTPSQPSYQNPMPGFCADRLVATKILLHGNVPGSYPFNRYRRTRWVIDIEHVPETERGMNSEMPFSRLSASLRQIWKGTYANIDEEKSLQRGMVLNRGWGDSPGSSCELLGGWEESADAPKAGYSNSVTNSGSGLGNTELYGFPGLLFEVLGNDAVSCLTIY